MLVTPRLYVAIALRAALRTYRDHKIMVNRSYTPANMLRTASNITGKKFKPGHYDHAIAALTVWIDNYQPEQ
jgi:hypothetical protein